MTSFPLNQDALRQMMAWAEHRITDGPDPTHGAKPPEHFQTALGQTITQDGMGWDKAFAMFTDVIVPSLRPYDHPASLAFVAAAPSPAAQTFDAVVGAAEIFAGNWDGGSGAVYAENQAIAWLASLAGWPATAGGVFVSGGTLGNLSALHAARVNAPFERPDRYRILCSSEAHSSIDAAARVMDAELVLIDTDEHGRMRTDLAEQALANTSGIFAIVANAGATNCGAVDDLSALATLAEQHGIWLHVDGAYGAAAMANPDNHATFQGIERADSFIVDPHKWLFAPYDSCALVYREPARAAKAHGQQAAYLDALDQSAWNPSDYALHLTRRARGLPLWFSLVAYGADAYADAIRATQATAAAIATGIDATDGLDLILGPQLTVILFRAPGRNGDELASWAEHNRRSGDILCLPTTWRSETVMRLCIVNPATDADEVLRVLRTLA